MANNLTPQQLAQIYSNLYGQGPNNREYYDPETKRSYAPIWSNGQGDADGNMLEQPRLTGIQGYDWEPGRYKDNTEMRGMMMDQYDPSGSFTGQTQFTGGLPNYMHWLGPLAVAALPFAAAAAGAGAAGAGAGAGAASAIPTTFGVVDTAAGALASAGGLGAVEGGLGAGLGGLGMGGAGDAAALGLDSGLMSSANALNATAAGTAGAGSTLTNAVKGAGSFLGEYGKYLAPLAGALAGSQKQEANQTSTKKMDPRFDPYYFGDNGVLNMGLSLLQRQQSPERLAEWDAIRGRGMGMLQAPMAGNGYSKFFPGA